MQKQREQLAVMIFLSALGPEYETIRSQILAGSDIDSLTTVYARVLRASIDSSPPSMGIDKSALMARTYQGGRGGGRRGRDRGRGCGRGRDSGRGVNKGGIVCYYCGDPRHIQ